MVYLISRRSFFYRLEDFVLCLWISSYQNELKISHRMKKLLLKLKCQKFKNTYLERHNAFLYLNNSGCVIWHVVCEVLELLHLYIFPAVASYWSFHCYLWVPKVFTCLSGIHIFLVYLVFLAKKNLWDYILS